MFIVCPVDPNTAHFRHPELKPGEMFLTNCRSGVPEEYENIPYQTRRAGTIAYDASGQSLPGYFPVFVWQSEYEGRPRELKVGQ